MLSYSSSGKLLRLVIIILIGVVSYGCSNKKGDALIPEKSSVSYKYKENVLPPTKKNLSYIKEVRQNSIVYKASTPSKKIPKVGDIITSGVCETFPHGIGVRVLDVQTLPNGDYECLTTPATIDQIFDDLKISSYTNLSDSDKNEVTAIDENGNEVKIKIVTTPEVKKQRSLINKNYLFAYPLSVIDLTIGKERSDVYYEIPFDSKQKTNPLDLGVTLEDISLAGTRNFNLSGNIHAGLGLIYECNLKARTFKLGLSANCGFEIKEWLIEGDESLSFDLFDLKILDRYIDLGPVVLNPAINLVLSAELNHSGYFSSHASKEIGIEVGITQDGTYKNIYSKGNNEKLIQIDSLNSRTGVSFPFYPKIAVGLYDDGLVNGKLEPSIRFGVETSCFFDDSDIFKTNPTLKLYSKGGLDASVNIFEDMKIAISKTGKIASFDIWEKGWPLLPVLDSKSVSIIPKKSGKTYVMSYGFSSDGILQKWKDNMWAGAKIVHGDSLIQQKPSEGIADLVSAKMKYEFTFDNLSLELDQSYMARPIVFYNNPDSSEQCNKGVRL